MDSYLSGCVLRCGPQPHAKLAVDTWRSPGCGASAALPTDAVVKCITAAWLTPASRAGAYFCTHAHADHTAGLSDTWCDGPLFCSEATRTLLLLKWPALRGRITALPFDETVTFAVGGADVSVTPFWSGHCPGSAAFLFHNTHLGRVLHTGDWRLEDLDALPQAVLAGPIDVLYLDNTFCHPCYNHPPRADALHLLRQAIERLIRTGDERLLLGIDTLGKEELLEAVADAIGGSVAVTPARLQSSRSLGLPDGHLTTCWHEARVVTVPRWRVNPRGLATLQARQVQSGGVPFTAAVLPTGWVRHVAVAEPGGEEAPREEEGGPIAATLAPVAIIQVPYSLHAPFTELERLVRLLAPRALIGVVASPRYADAPIDPVLHFSHLLRRDGPAPALPCLEDTHQLAASAGAAPNQAPVPPVADPAGRDSRRQRGARSEAPHQPGTKSLLTLSPRAMLACMQRAAGNAALAVLATARKRAVRALALTPQAAPPGDDDVQENKPAACAEPLPAAKRARES